MRFNRTVILLITCLALMASLLFSVQAQEPNPVYLPVVVGGGEAAHATATPTATPTPTATATQTPTLAALSVYFLDVGQGDSTLLVGPDFTLLIDAGRHDRNDVVPQLEQIGVEAIDLLVGTHPHADHIGQFPQVLARYPVTEVWMSGDAHTSLTFERAVDAILASDAAYREPRAHETYTIGSAVVEVLNPLTLTGDFHEGSVSLRVVYGAVAFLFTGDAEAATEAALIGRGHPLAAQILQLGHHGSSTSSSAAFLQAVQPDLAIWSAGAGNSYGHPHADVLDRLAGLGVLVCGTADYGTLVVQTNGQGYSVQNEACAGPGTPPTATATATATATPTATSPATCVNINTASHAELQQIVHIGPDRATQLISLRPFNSVDDLIRLDGIGPARLQDIKDQGLACG
jgi:competence protein ComEC